MIISLGVGVTIMDGSPAHEYKMASKVAVGHVVQLLYGGCFGSTRVSKTGPDIHRHQALSLAHHQLLGRLVARQRARRNGQAFTLAQQLVAAFVDVGTA